MSDQVQPDPENTNDENEPTFAISNGAYDKLRFAAVILLPGVATLYFALAGVLGLPAAEQVVGSITAVDAFLGLILRSLRVSYEKSDARYDGQITVAPDHEAGTTDVGVRLDPEAIANKDEVLVKVKKV